MTEAETLTDEDLFLGTPKEPTAPAQTPEPEPKAEPEPQQDAAGQQPQSEPEAEQQQEPEDKGGRVPAWRLREVAEEARQAKREAEEQRARAAEYEANLRAVQQQMQAIQAAQSAKPAPDRWQDPDAYEAYREQQQRAVYQQMAAQVAETRAAVKYGWQAVEEAIEAAKKAEMANPQVGWMIAAAPNPWEAAVEWHRREKVISQVGEDPKAYADRIKAEAVASVKNDPEFRKQLLAELRAEAQAAPQGQGRSAALPSMNGIASGRTAVPEGPQSDEALFYTR